jgi:hypothetical protein
VTSGTVSNPEYQVEVDAFWRDGYTIVRNVYSNEEIEGFRDRALAFDGKKSDILSNPGLRSSLTDGRLVSIARSILGSNDIMYAGDSSFTVGNIQRGYHKDNADRTDGNAPDWRGRYTILRFGIYLQDHERHTNGLNVRVGSHNSVTLTDGKHSYLRSRVGDVAVWSLRISHSGNGTMLRFPWWKYPMPDVDPASYPKWWKVAPEGRTPRVAIFAALGLDDAHHERYTTYLKTRTYIVNMWRNSHYTDEALAEAAAIGLKVRNVPAEIVDDPTVGQNGPWRAIPY